MKSHVERRCRECGIGTIRPIARAGRRMRHKTLELEVPAALAIPTCDNCGAEWMDRATAKEIDAALEGAYRQALRRTLEAVLKTIAARAPMRQVERAIGVSEGYLSKLKKGRSEPSAELVSGLSLLARDVEGGLQNLGRLWTQAEKVGGPHHIPLRITGMTGAQRDSLHERKYGKPVKAPNSKKHGTDAR
jgi:transcriptional regulator with XRE-family HTH domain